jgi:predicted transcriptional regulator
LKSVEKSKQVLAFEAAPDVRDAVDSLAAAMDVSRSWILRTAVKRFLDDAPTPAKEVPSPKLRADEGTWSGLE